MPSWSPSAEARSARPSSLHGHTASAVKPTIIPLEDNDEKHDKQPTLCQPSPMVAMTVEEQSTAICEAFANLDTFPAETEIKNAIGKIHSLVLPHNKAQAHIAAPLIHSYTTHGCPTNCGPDCTMDHIRAAIEKGPNASALDPDALDALHAETEDKVKNRYTKVICFGDIMEDLPNKLKISPVAMIPHKSRVFRTILDLSFCLKHEEKIMESINSASVQQAPAEAMVQLSKCMKCLVALLADNRDPNHPFKFAKLDIKDSFGRMAVSNKDAWNFCYVLPCCEKTTTIEDALLVIPKCLQMGWCESPPFFVQHLKRHGMSSRLSYRRHPFPRTHSKTKCSLQTHRRRHQG